LADGLRETGLDAVSIGQVPTPLLYYALATLGAGRDSGAMVTASHNPPQYNGLKIVSSGRALAGEQIVALRERAGQARTAAVRGGYREIDVKDAYIARLAGDLKIARPVRVAMDCGNGTAGIVARRLFTTLGLQPDFLYEEPDGRFPNHPADPIVPANLKDLAAKVTQGGYELGIAFDGDSDRIGVVDEKGRFVWGDRLLALYARDLLRIRPGSMVIFDVKCSRALPEDILAHGGRPLMWRTGHSFMKAKLREEKALLAGEMSGHIFFADRYYGYDDAMYAAGRILEIVSRAERPLGELLDDMPRYFSTPELKRACPDDKKFAIVAALRDRFAATYKVVDIDGVRVEFPDGWGLVRASNTGPVLVLRFEARTEARLSEIRGVIEGALAELLPAGSEEEAYG
jgi:phosphomannomutase/phosphoglucomutase